MSQILKTCFSALVLTLLPQEVFAQTDAVLTSNGASVAAMFLAFAGLVFFLSRAWIGIVNITLIENESISSIEARKPYLPSFLTIGIALISTVFLMAYLVDMVGGIAPFTGPRVFQLLASIVGTFGILWAISSYKWPYESQKYLFAFITGTILTFALMASKQAILQQQVSNPFVMAIAVVSIIAFWKLLFGPWHRNVKIAMLLTFIFWSGLHLFAKQPPTDRLAYAFTVGIAMIPAAIWCGLFLEYHKQRFSLVILMFCAGMLSTAPILFYDALVRSGVELNFFLFTLKPESFIGTSNAFVSSTSIGVGTQTRVLATLVSFMLVGLIEECSKFWVLKESGKKEFTSIDDVLQLAIVAAIGFAFAENILNPSYFYGFVQQYLIRPETKDWSGFLGNILGRSVLTSMVHIVSSGVLGYFYALRLFARPYLNDAHRDRKKLRGLHILQSITHLPEKIVFQREMMVAGFVLSITLHGFFNFFVTLPDILPGNPQTVGELIGMPSGTFLHGIALIMIPSLLYVVGGFWVLSMLFYKKESIKERGHVIQVEAYVS